MSLDFTEAAAAGLNRVLSQTESPGYRLVEAIKAERIAIERDEIIASISRDLQEAYGQHDIPQSDLNTSARVYAENFLIRQAGDEVPTISRHWDVPQM